GLGVSLTDGLYADAAAVEAAGLPVPELVVRLDVTPPANLHVTGRLGFLQLDITDTATAPAEGFHGTFTVDLQDPSPAGPAHHAGRLTFAVLTATDTTLDDVVTFGLDAEADLHLNLAASFQGNVNFPRVLVDFHLGWQFSLADPTL